MVKESHSTLLLRVGTPKPEPNGRVMAIDFSFSPEIDEIRLKVRQFIETVARAMCSTWNVERETWNGGAA